MFSSNSQGQLPIHTNEAQHSPHGGSQKNRISKGLEAESATQAYVSGLAQIKEANYDERTPQATLTEVRANYNSCSENRAKQVQLLDNDHVTDPDSVPLGEDARVGDVKWK